MRIFPAVGRRSQAVQMVSCDLELPVCCAPLVNPETPCSGDEFSWHRRACARWLACTSIV